MTSWIPIIGYEDKYEISEDGRIRTNGKHCDGRQFPAKELKQHVQNGYMTVDLWKNKKCSSKYTHRLVLESFTISCPKGFECNHRDGNKTNNCLENLEWVTRRDNQLHAIRLGLRPCRTKGAFKKGHKPWNAGKNTGQRPWNYVSDRQCKTQGCEGEYFCRGMCAKCHRRSRYLKEHNLLPDSPTKQ